METKETLQEIIKKDNETKALQDKIIAEAEENLKKVGKKKTRPEYGEEYLFISILGTIRKDYFDSGNDEEIWNSGNGFFTNEEAEKELFKRLAIQRVKDYLIENDLLCSEEEVHDDYVVKHCVWCDIKGKDSGFSGFYMSKKYSPFGYLKSENEQFLDDCKEDLLLIFG